MNPDLIEYVEENIFPQYKKYYSHGMLHINEVIKNILYLANYYQLDKNMAYTAASYHDLGLKVSRDNHELESGKILASDANLKTFFTDEQIKIIRQAVEDHRGSRKIKPRNIYGECLSDSDRDFSVAILAKRQLGTSLKHYPELREFEDHFERCYSYMLSRINTKGKFNLWTENPTLQEKRDAFQLAYLDKDGARKIYKKEWEKISKDGTMEKIINYYMDY